MKGIVLAGGTGSRLHPLTKIISKHLLPVYDKPMIYYPISVLMLAGIQDILIISTPEDTPRFKKLLGTGEQLGISFSYGIQPSPDGLSQAFIIAEEFIGGDNIFYGQGFPDLLRRAASRVSGATIFAHRVKDPQRFGVATFGEDGQVTSIVEKPPSPLSDYAITGLYFYDNKVVTYAKQLCPSSRGELEITDLNEIYLKQGTLHVELLGRGYAWLDTGTHDSLLQASQFIATIEKRQGLKVACLEEIAFIMKYISIDQMIQIAKSLGSSDYKQYLLDIAQTRE